MNQDLSVTPYKDRVRSQKQEALDNWIRNQIAQTPELKARRKGWKTAANKELNNIGMKTIS